MLARLPGRKLMLFFKMDKMFEILKKELPRIQKNALLKHHTTFKIGGPADYFFIAKKTEDIMNAIKTAKKMKLPVFVLGSGSNLLVSDHGFRGLVIKMDNTPVIKQKSQLVIFAEAGTEMKDLVIFSVNKSLQGLEWAGGLPGTFGGAIRGNAGAFGSEMKDSILQVEAIDNNFALKKLLNKQCHFSYRSSIFKKKNWTVVSATITLKKGNKKELENIAKSHSKYRKERHPLEFPNAGSIFKNVPLSEFSPKLKGNLAGVVKKDPFPVIPTAFLVSEAGLKGTRVGQAAVSEKHPNFIVNLGNAKAKDVLTLIDIVKKKVKKMYGIQLETEVQLLK